MQVVLTGTVNGGLAIAIWQTNGIWIILNKALDHGEARIVGVSVWYSLVSLHRKVQGNLPLTCDVAPGLASMITVTASGVGFNAHARCNSNIPSCRSS